MEKIITQFIKYLPSLELLLFLPVHFAVKKRERRKRRLDPVVCTPSSRNAGTGPRFPGCHSIRNPR